MSSSMQVVEPVFSSLGPHIALFTPLDAIPGELIIFCSWLGAARNHMAKYALEYRKIAPRSKILLIESSLSILTTRYTKQWKAIKPAAEAVLATLAESGFDQATQKKGNPKIILHTSSNGGNNSATQLLIVLNRILNIPLPLAGIICDSGPAKGEYWKSYQSMIYSLPRGLLWKIFAPVIVHAVCLVLFSSQWVGWEKPEKIYRRTLLDERIVKCGRICYLYSKADKEVEWRDVTSHAQDARAKGWHVDEMRFEDTPHCNHVSKYKREYFGAVRRVWGSGLDQ